MTTEDLWAAFTNSLTPEKQTVVSSAFSLLLCVRAPLSTSTFDEALPECWLGSKGDFGKELNVEIHQSISGCFFDQLQCTFIAISGDTYRLSEPVKEYLLTLPEYQSISNNAVVAVGCLKCLTSEATLNQDYQRAPFRSLWHEYSALYWADHLSACQALRRGTCLQSFCAEFIPHDIPATPAFAAWSTAATDATHGHGKVTLHGWGADVESTLARPPDSILVAVAWGFNDIAAARLEIDSGDAKARGFEFNNPHLHIAAESGNAEAIPMLLDRDVDIEDRDGFNDTAVLGATMRGQAETVELLLICGAVAQVLNERNHMTSPLQVAAREGFSDIVQMLLGFGANPRTETTDGMTLLELAIECGHEEVVKILLKPFPEDFPDKSDVRLAAARLHHALHDKSLRGFCVELKKWSSSPSSDNYLDIVLWKAAGQGSVDAVELLIHKGVSVNTIHHGQSVLWVAAQGDERGDNLGADLATVKLLLKHGADPNAPSPSRFVKLLLCQAAYEGNLELVKLLVDNGADVNLAADGGPSPLHEAVSGDEVAVVEFLLENRVDVNYIGHATRCRRNYGPGEHTMLVVAEEEGSAEIVRLLMDHGGKRMTGTEN